MRSVKLGTADKDIRDGDTVPLARKRSELRSLDETYFAAELRPGAVIYTGAGAVDGMNSFAPVLILPAAASTSAAANFGTRKLWPLTRPRLTVLYTSPVGSTALFGLTFTLVFLGPGVTTTAPFLSVTWTAPGPAVANTILSTSTTMSPHLTQPFGATKVQLRRNGPDANANDLHVILAGVTFEEVA